MRLPARSGGERFNARFAGTEESCDAGAGDSSEGFENKGEGEAEDIFTISKFRTALKAFACKIFLVKY